MLINFVKYHGTGNDFIIINNIVTPLKQLSVETVRFLCDRHMGIGADGLIILKKHPVLDFEMVYYNSDGKESTMCGNGGRCITAFAKRAGLVSNSVKFKTIDGIHEANIQGNGMVNLKMKDVLNIEQGDDYFVLDTGSPHYVKFVKGIENYDVYSEARKIRFNDRFRQEGTNVNFVEDKGNKIFVRTYERGVENETLSCGTGIVAAVICFAAEKNFETDYIDIQTRGGDLKVTFDRSEDNTFKNIWLEGPAKFVFEGSIDI